jgi:hypothetical protein
MVIINFTGLDMFLIGELDQKIHSQVAKVLGLDDEEVIFASTDSFLFYHGHEQTSYNLYIKVEAPYSLKIKEKALANLLLLESKNFSVHTRLLFTYFDEDRYYERVDDNYPEYIIAASEVTTEDEYDQDKEYSEDELYTGNIFKDNNFSDDNDGSLSIDELLKRK